MISKKKWCTYHRSNSHSNEDGYQQQSVTKSEGLGNNRKGWCQYQNSDSHSRDKYYPQRASKFENSSSVDGKNSGKKKNVIADSTSTGCTTKFCCN